MVGENQKTPEKRVPPPPRPSALPPHLALPLLVPAEELPDLVQESGVLLPAAQPEGGLSGAACGCHASVLLSGFGRVERAGFSCRSLK